MRRCRSAGFGAALRSGVIDGRCWWSRQSQTQTTALQRYIRSITFCRSLRHSQYQIMSFDVRWVLEGQPSVVTRRAGSRWTGTVRRELSAASKETRFPLGVDYVHPGEGLSNKAHPRLVHSGIHSLWPYMHKDSINHPQPHPREPFAPIKRV